MPVCLYAVVPHTAGRRVAGNALVLLLHPHVRMVVSETWLHQSFNKLHHIGHTQKAADTTCQGNQLAPTEG